MSQQLLEVRGTRRTPVSLAPRVWWLSPVVVSLVVAVAAITPAALLSDPDYRLLWRTPKVITGQTLLLFGCGAVALAFGAMIVIAVAPSRRALPVTWPSLSTNSLSFLKRSSNVLTALTLVGYAGFAYLIIRSGLQPAQLISGYGSDSWYVTLSAPSPGSLH